MSEAGETVAGDSNAVVTAIENIIHQFYPGETSVQAAKFLVDSAMSAALAVASKDQGLLLRSALLDTFVGVIAVAKAEDLDIIEAVNGALRVRFGRGVAITFVE